jgi:hypothetical protein
VVIENTTTLVSIPHPSATEKRSRQWATHGILAPPTRSLQPSRARDAIKASRQEDRAWCKTTGSMPRWPARSIARRMAIGFSRARQEKNEPWFTCAEASARPSSDEGAPTMALLRFAFYLIFFSKLRSPPKLSAFRPAFHERVFLARGICTTILIIQNATPVRVSGNVASDPSLPPESQSPVPSFPASPDEFLPPVAPICASRPAPACAARPTVRRQPLPSTTPSLSGCAPPPSAILDATLMSQSPGLSASVESPHLSLGLGAEFLCGFGTLLRGEVN